VAVFLSGSVALGWLATVIVAGLPSGMIPLPLLAIPVSYVPAVAALMILRVSGKPEERAEFRARMTRVRTGWRSWAIAATGLPLIYLAGIGLASHFGGNVPFQPAMLLFLPLFLLTNFGEEVGWRGYAVPALQRTRSPLAAALITGLAWGAFHWVALLANAEAPLTYLAIGTVMFLAFSIIMTALFDCGRQAVPLVALSHAAYDTFAIGVSPLNATGVPLLAFVLVATVACVVAGVIVAITGPSLRPRRRVLQRTPPPHLDTGGARESGRAPNGCADFGGVLVDAEKGTVS